jgi:magnesium-transporting ATPase (P-type)
VNAIVVMEIFYLFSVRYLRVGSATWHGVLGTPAVLIGIAATILLQVAVTYLPRLQSVFETRPVGIAGGVLIIGIGIALFAVLEVEKFILRRRAGAGGRAEPPACRYFGQ